MKKIQPLEKAGEGLKKMAGNHRRRMPRARRKWRIEIINENTLARIASLRLTGLRARIALIAAIASIVSLVVVVFTLTPLGGWIWGERDLRNQYVEMSLRLDSLNAVASVNAAYAANIAAILSDSLPADSSAYRPPMPEVTDTLPEASEAERLFVERFESESRFNLSVLSPIAAEGMIFESPVREVGAGGPVMAVYRGTVIGVFVAPDGSQTILIQHPNDFISSYASLTDSYVSKGSKVVAGQRIGHAEHEPAFELWRGGTALDAHKYISFPVPTSIEK